MTVSTPQVAAVLKVSRQRINELGRQGKIKRESNGEWDLDKVKAALKRNLDIHQVSPARDKGDRPSQTNGRGYIPVTGTPAHAQFLKTSAQAAQEIMLAKKMEGSLVDSKAVMQGLSDMVAMAKTRLLGIGNKLAPTLAAENEPAKIQAAIEAEVYEALTDLSRWRLA